MAGESKGQRTRSQEAYGITGLGLRERDLGIAPWCHYSVEGGGRQTEGRQTDTQETEELGKGTREGTDPLEGCPGLHLHLMAVEASSSEIGRALGGQWFQGTLPTLCQQRGHPPLHSTPSALGSFASLTALCSSGIHTPYVSTQSCRC